MPTTILIAAALAVRADGHVLLVRKRGTTAFMQPGGKIEPGETPLSALRRELAEELGFVLETEPDYLGRFSAIAANEPDAMVMAEVFVVEMPAGIRPAAEIAEIRWVDPAAPGAIELAPLTGGEILPFWCNRRGISKVI